MRGNGRQQLSSHNSGFLPVEQAVDEVSLDMAETQLAVCGAVGENPGQSVEYHDKGEDNCDKKKKAKEKQVIGNPFLI